jgi:alpha-beta hydrolase superfamily lysophospholipase
MDSRHISSQFMADGERLLLQAWLPAGPDAEGHPAAAAVIAVVHGYGDHGGRYAWLGEDMASRGHALYTYDLRGHGQSTGTRGQVKRFDEYLDDTGVFLDEVRRSQPDAPLFLLGHSMGGLIVAKYAEERASQLESHGVRGVILSSPFLQLAEAVPPSRVLAAKGLAKVWPHKDIGNSVQAAQLSHDQTVVEAYVTDRLVHHVAPARWAAEALAAQDATMAGAARITQPLLVLYGTEDQVVDIAFIEALFAKAASEDKSIERYEGLYHECFNETGREQVFHDLAAWLASRLPASAGL